ncbi:hypothetical protein ACK3ZS_20330, partial [Aeromonas caviae]
TGISAQSGITTLSGKKCLDLWGQIQFPRIIIALQKGRIVDRAWLYTAITRAEHEVHIVGSTAEFAAITKAPSNAHNRNSYLRDLLKK